MARRFIDTELFKDPFIRGLDAPLKTLWIYIFCDCDASGIWTVEIDVACLRLGIDIKLEKVKKAFAPKIIEIDSGSMWFIPSFIHLQYNNELKDNNKALSKVIPRLLHYDLVTSTEEGVYSLKSEIKGLSRGLNAPKEEEEEEEREKEKEKDKEEAELWPTFSDFWEEYDKKIDRDKSEKLWKKLKQDEKEDIMHFIPQYKQSSEKQYRRNPTTFLNSKHWENEIITKTGQSGVDQKLEVMQILNAQRRL